MSSQKKIFQSSGAPGFNSHFYSNKSGIFFFTVSLLLHGLFFLVIVFFHDFQFPKPMPPVIKIDLVSFVEEPDLEPLPEKAVEKSEEVDLSTPENVTSVKKETIKKIEKEIPTIKPAVSLKTKPKNLKALMEQNKKKRKETIKKKKETNIVKKAKLKKDINAAKLLEKAREDLEKKVEKQNQDRLASALKRLKDKVKNRGEKQGTAKNPMEKGYKPIDLYKMVLGSAIEQNWVYNDTLARIDQNLEVRILIKILKSGEIRDIIYETRSGSHYLDESAKKAIKKANPLPQLPAGIRSYDLVVIFTPKGLK